MPNLIYEYNYDDQDGSGIYIIPYYGKEFGLVKFPQDITSQIWQLLLFGFSWYWYLHRRRSFVFFLIMTVHIFGSYLA